MTCQSYLDAQAEAEAERACAAFLEYRGDTYLTDGWLADGRLGPERKAWKDPRRSTEPCVHTGVHIEGPC